MSEKEKNIKKIAILDVDYKKYTNIYNKSKIFPNLALMKISAYYKKKGYKVEWYKPIKYYFNNYHKIFASKVFTYENSMTPYMRKEMITGGSGFNINTKLPDKIEHIYPDYDLYGIDYAMGFITRGCIRNCEFCIVPKKEGLIHKNADIEEFWHDQEKIRLLDNNLLAYKKHVEELKKLIEINKKIDFNQGLDIRLITNENASLLREIKRWEGQRYRFAFDDIKLKPLIEKKLIILNNNGIKNSMITFFVLIGFNTTLEEDLIRFNFLKEKGIRAYAMPYDKTIQYQKDLLKWVNFKPFYFKMSFETFVKYKKEINKGNMKNVIKASKTITKNILEENITNIKHRSNLKQLLKQ